LISSICSPDINLRFGKGLANGVVPALECRYDCESDNDGDVGDKGVIIGDDVGMYAIGITFSKSVIVSFSSKVALLSKPRSLPTFNFERFFNTKYP